MQRKDFLRLALVSGLGLPLGAAPVAAQSAKFPVKPVRIIVPYAPGGSGEVVARHVGVKLTELWGQQVIVEAKPGASGMIGTEYVAKAPADGYTLLLGTDIQFAINPALYAKIAYDPEKDFEPVAQAANIEFVLVTPASLNVKTLPELVALAKANPGALNYASSGSGSTHHLSMELLKSMTGVDINHVPYKGSGQALPDVISGQVQMMYVGVAQTIPHIRSGRLRGLAVGSAKRLPAVPEIPTFAESYPGFEANASWNFFAPAATPKDIVAQLNRDIVRVLRTPEVVTRLSEGGLEVIGSTPGELAARMRADRTKWGRVVRRLNLKVD